MASQLGIDGGIALLGSVAAARPDVDGEQLVSVLIERGVDPGSARRLVTFVPLALGRVLLDGMGIRFVDTYVSATGADSQEYRLADVVEFTAASGAASWLAPQQISALAMRSSEVSAVNQALQGGSRPEDLILGPPLITWM